MVIVTDDTAVGLSNEEINMQYYYLKHGYSIDDLTHDDESDLVGPFASPEARWAAFDEDMRGYDLETSTTLHVTFLEVNAHNSLSHHEAGLVTTVSWLPVGDVLGERSGLWGCPQEAIDA